MNDCVFEMDLGNRGCLVVEVEPLHFGLVDGGSCTCVRGREGIWKLAVSRPFQNLRKDGLCYKGDNWSGGHLVVE